VPKTGSHAKHSSYGYHTGYSYPYYAHSPSWWSFGFSAGFGHFGSHHHHFGFHSWWPGVHFGSHSVALLAGGAWHIQPYSYGWFGFRHGGHCYYWPRWHHRHHWFHYDGWYCRIHRPYWYGYTRWYDWRPYGYGYTSLSYDGLYDDGYGDGYNRGYEDGAEDSSAYRDDRRRDRIGEKPSPTVPDPAKDRERGNAAQEYRHEMTRGSTAFSNGDYVTATKAFKEAIILDPSSSEARYSLAVSAFAQGKYAFSAFALRRGVVLDSDGSNIDLVKAFGGPEVLKGYVDHLEKELAIAPEDPDLLLLHGFVKLRTGETAAAAQSLDKALARLPQDRATKVLHEEAVNALDG
jgi:hypothetical protein